MRARALSNDKASWQAGNGVRVWLASDYVRTDRYARAGFAHLHREQCRSGGKKIVSRILSFALRECAIA